MKSQIHNSTCEHALTMDYESFYHGAVALNCIIIVHLCLHRVDKCQERHFFLAVVVLTMARLLMDIIFRHRHDEYMNILGFFLVLEFLLLDCVVRKMHKLASSPPIIVFVLTLIMLFADISYGLHLTTLL